MTTQDDIASACAHLTAALELLDRLELHAPAADVSMALHRLQEHEPAGKIGINPDANTGLPTP